MTSDPRSAEFQRLYQTAVTFAQEGTEAEAGQAFARAAAYAPEKWCDVATRLAKEGQEAIALEHFRTALQVTVHPGIRSGIFNNIAIIYAKRAQLYEALEMLNQAIREDPQSADALTNFGQVHKWRGDLDRAESYCSRALAINPWHSEAQFLQALNALDRGDYGRGFPLYECRWRSRTNGYRKLECFFPEWSGPGATFQGEPLKRLFVYCEQGAGDIFLMLRYAPLIRAAGMWQSWAVKRGMAGLAGELVDHVTENAEPPVEFDCHVASASLPAIFGTTLQTVPRDPYLKAPAAVDYGPGFHVGIAWRGNKGQYNDAIRSTALSDWRPVMELAGDHPSPWPSPLGGEREHGSHRVTFHALQVDGAEEALLYPEIEMHEPPKDWSETAARLAGLDLLITVDTGIAHLAGAMGLPVWCALHCRPYFVFPLACEGSPWYPTMRLFKQQRAFEWQPVFSRIADELRKTLSQIHRPVAKPMGLVSGSQV